MYMYMYIHISTMCMGSGLHNTMSDWGNYMTCTMYVC